MKKILIKIRPILAWSGLVYLAVDLQWIPLVLIMSGAIISIIIDNYD